MSDAADAPAGPVAAPILDPDEVPDLVEDLEGTAGGGEMTSSAPPNQGRAWRLPRRAWAALLSAVYLVGIATGWTIWGATPSPAAVAGDRAASTSAPSAPAPSTPAPSDAPMSHAPVAVVNPDDINPPGGVTLPVSFGGIGPRLVAAGVIDRAAFERMYSDGGRPLTPDESALLTAGSEAPIVVRKENAPVLLNLLWATGLATQNRILTEGPMMQQGKEAVVNFASTGGWTLAAKPITKIYAALALIPLTEAQQARLEEASRIVYRPCCDNATYFPDCNHGMAMLGLLEMMAAKGASVADMLAAAKSVNAFWFPQQTANLAAMLKTTKGVDFLAADARLVVGQLSSASGSKAISQWIAQSNGGNGAPGGSGGSCGVK